MKALAIVSSPRKGGNSELAAKEILSQMPDSWEKEMIRLNDLNFKLCTACYACIPEEKKCKLDDDLDFFLERIKSADKIIIACPVYFLGTHTTLKLVLDRLLSILANHKEFAGKDCVLVSFYGLDKWEGAVNENMIIFARELHLNIADVATLLATIPGESVEGENLSVIHRLAQSLINPPAKPYHKEGELHCTYCHGAAITPYADGNWRCAICGGTGTISHENGNLSLIPDTQNNSHFTFENKMKHLNYLAEKKQYFLDNRTHVKEIQAKYANMNWWVRP